MKTYKLLIFVMILLFSIIVYSVTINVTKPDKCVIEYYNAIGHNTIQKSHTCDDDIDIYNKSYFNCNEYVNHYFISRDKNTFFWTERETALVEKSKEVCKDRGIIDISIDNTDKYIDYDTWGRCNIDGDTIICDSKYDGNNDGICTSGESCMKCIVTKDDIDCNYKNSEESFIKDEPSWFLDKLKVKSR